MLADTASAAPPDTRPSLSELFWTFLRIGAMGFGGVFALVSLQQKVIVQQREWMSTEEFLASSGVGALAPGPLSSNITAVVGYRLRGLAGGAVAYVAYHLPALVAVLVLAVYFRHVESLPVVRGALRGVTAAVIGLLFGVLWRMLQTLVTGVRSAIVLAVPLTALIVLNANPVVVVLGTGLLSYFVFRGDGRDCS